MDTRPASQPCGLLFGADPDPTQHPPPQPWGFRTPHSCHREAAEDRGPRCGRAQSGSQMGSGLAGLPCQLCAGQGRAVVGCSGERCAVPRLWGLGRRAGVQLCGSPRRCSERRTAAEPVPSSLCPCPAPGRPSSRRHRRCQGPGDLPAPGRAPQEGLAPLPWGWGRAPGKRPCRRPLGSCWGPGRGHRGRPRRGRLGGVPAVLALCPPCPVCRPRPGGAGSSPAAWCLSRSAVSLLQSRTRGGHRRGR